MGLNEENLEAVVCFKYLGIDMAENGPMEVEVSHSLDEEAKVRGALRSMWKERSLSLKT